MDIIVNTDNIGSPDYTTLWAAFSSFTTLTEDIDIYFSGATNDTSLTSSNRLRDKTTNGYKIRVIGDRSLTASEWNNAVGTIEISSYFRNYNVIGFEMKNVQVDVLAAATYGFYSTYAGTSYLENCLFRTPATFGAHAVMCGTDATAGALTTINKCIFIGNDGSGAAIIHFDAVADSIITECTIHNYDIGITTNAVTTLPIITDCAIFDNTTSDISGNISSSNVSYCATDDGYGSNSVSPLDWDTVFTDYANDDFTLLVTDTELTGAGSTGNNIGWYQGAAVTQYTLTYGVGTGSGIISGTSPQIVDQGSSGSTVVAVASAGQMFGSWTDAYPTAARTDTNVQNDITVSANFVDEVIYYDITVSAGSNGAVNPTGIQSVTSGGDLTVSSTPSANYVLATWIGTSGLNIDTPTSASTKISNVTVDGTISAVFSAVAFYDVVYNVNYTSGGVIIGDTNQSVAPGGDATTVTASAAPDHEFLGWSGGDLNTNRLNPTVRTGDTNIQSDLTITAMFGVIDRYSAGEDITIGDGGRFLDPIHAMKNQLTPLTGRVRLSAISNTEVYTRWDIGDGRDHAGYEWEFDGGSHLVSGTGARQHMYVINVTSASKIIWHDYTLLSQRTFASPYAHRGSYARKSHLELVDYNSKLIVTDTGSTPGHVWYVYGGTHDGDPINNVSLKLTHYNSTYHWNTDPGEGAWFLESNYPEPTKLTVDLQNLGFSSPNNSMVLFRSHYDGTVDSLSGNISNSSFFGFNDTCFEPVSAAYENIMTTDATGDIPSVTPSAQYVSLDPYSEDYFLPIEGTAADVSGSQPTLSLVDMKGETWVSPYTIGPVQRTVTNIPPVSNDNGIWVTRGSSSTILSSGETSVLYNDTDADGQILSAYKLTDPSYGTLVLGISGTFLYTHDGSANLIDSFTYRAFDGITSGNAATVFISAANTAPVSNDNGITLSRGATSTTLSSGETSVLYNDTDPESDTLTAYKLTDPSYGTLVLDTDGTFSYTHDGSVNLIDSFTYQAFDGVTSGNTATVFVSASNTAPVSNNNGITLSRGTSSSTLSSGQTSVLYNDTDPETDTLTAYKLTDPSYGTLVLNTDGTFVYTHDGSINVIDLFTYRAFDGITSGNAATVNISASNVAPVSNDNGILAAKGGTSTILSSGETSVLYNDTDTESDTLSAYKLTDPDYGTVTLNLDGTFSYTHDDSLNLVDSFTYRAFDGLVYGNTATVHISASNAIPVSNDNGITLLRGATSTILSSGETSVLYNDTDANGDTLSAYKATEPSYGSVTLNIDGTFSYTHDNSLNVIDSFTYRAFDGITSGNAATVHISAINVAPVSNDNGITLVKGATSTILSSGETSVLYNDTDAESDTLSAYKLTDPSHGTLVLDVDGTFSYTHDDSINLVDSFTYRAFDGITSGNAATVFISASNSAPVSNDNGITLPRGTTSTTLSSGETSVLYNDTDPESDTLTAFKLTDPSYGTLVLETDGTFSYTHDGSLNVIDSFTYQAFDGITSGNAATVHISASNTAPVSNDNGLFASKGGTSTILSGGQSTVLFNDTDANSDTLSAYKLTDPDYGTLILNLDGTFSYTHDDSTNLMDSFTYRAFDGITSGNAATVYVSIANAAPVANNNGITLSRGATSTILSSGETSVLYNDIDANGDTLSAYKLTEPTQGSVTLNLDGTFSYTHNDSANLIDSFTYRAFDGLVYSNAATVFISAANTAPVSNDNGITLVKGATSTILSSGETSVLYNDTDAESDTLSAYKLTDPSYGSLTLNIDGTFSYTHDNSFNLVDSFTYRAFDGITSGNAATVHISASNSSPVSNDNGIWVTRGSSSTILSSGETSVLYNDTDPESDSLSAYKATDPIHGTLVLDTDGTFIYTHDGTTNLIDSFTYQAFDGITSGNAATVFVSAANTAPVSNDNGITLSRGTSSILLSGGQSTVLFNDTDAESDTLSAYKLTDPSYGTATLDLDGTFVYTHDGSLNVIDTFTYRSFDGIDYSNTATVHISASNEAPVSNDNGIWVSRGSSSTILSSGETSVLYNDTDANSDTLSAYKLTDPSYGTLILNVNGTFDYTHDGSINLIDEFTYQAFDGITSGNAATVFVSAANVAPVSNDNGITLSRGTSSSTLSSGETSVLYNDTDVNTDSLTAYKLTDPSYGILVLNTDGTFVYTHDNSLNVIDSFTYRAFDGITSGNAATVNISAINVAPVSNDNGILVNKGATSTILSSGETSVLYNDIDAESDTLSAYKLTEPNNGIVTLNSDGTFSYTHDDGGSTRDEFTYRSFDGLDYSSPATVFIAIPNTPPVSNDCSATCQKGKTTIRLVGGQTSILFNDTDVNDDTLTAILSSDVSNGTLILDSDGTFRYTHDDGGTVEDSFTYSAFDGFAHSNLSTVNIAITSATSGSSNGIDYDVTLDGETIRMVSLTRNGNQKYITYIDSSNNLVHKVRQLSDLVAEDSSNNGSGGLNYEATLDGEAVRIVNVRRNGVQNYITYIDSSNNLMFKVKQLSDLIGTNIV